jgi:hypothetical protein
MSHSSQNPAEDRAARRERLRLLCAADRSRVRLLWRLPVRAANGGKLDLWSGSMLAVPAIGALLPHVPGPIGRWSRRLRTGGSILRSAMRAAAA